MTTTAEPNWHILGAGAIGSLWASHGHLHGHPFTLILRDAQRLADYQSARGITANLGGSAQHLPLKATCPSQLGEPVSHLLICAKAQQTQAAVAAIAAHLSDDAVVVLLQNGLGTAAPLLQHKPSLRLLQASTTEGVFRNGPFSIVHAGRGQTLLGQSTALTLPPMGEEFIAGIARQLSVGPLQVTPVADIDTVLWQKLLVNCAINPLTVKYRCRNGELLDNPLALQELGDIVNEIAKVNHALGYRENETELLGRVRQVASKTALNRSSMLQDIEAGRETEIEFITGYLCRLGTELGLSLPRNQSLLTLVREA